MNASANDITEDFACEDCGKPGAVEMGERRLCPDCIVLAGSSCAGGAEE